MVSNVERSTSPEMIHLDLVLVGDFLVFSHGKSTRSGESRGFLIDPAPWHTSGAGTRSARGEAFGGTDGEIRLQDRTYGTHVGKGGQSGDEW